MRSNYEEDFFRTPEILETVVCTVKSSCLFDCDPFVYFSGCGTSWYLGQIAAAVYCQKPARNAAAVSCSDVFLFPEQVLKKTENALFVLISRSGESAEAVYALREAKKRGLKTLVLGCKRESAIMGEADYKVCIDAMERTILESFSFTGQAAALLLLSGNYPCAAELPEKSRKFIADFGIFLEGFCPGRFRRFVCLGYQANLAVCREGALKIGELTLLSAESYSPLEYRHGPRSWAGSDTLAVFLSSSVSQKYDTAVASEILSTGASVLWIGPFPEGFSGFDTGARNELETAVLNSLALQYLAIVCGRSGKVDFDNPENLVHAVRSL